MPSSSPAQARPQASQAEAANALLDVLAGFEALTTKVDELVKRNADLERQLQTFKQDRNQEPELVYKEAGGSTSDHRQTQEDADRKRDKKIGRGITALAMLQQNASSEGIQMNAEPSLFANGVSVHDSSKHGSLEQDHTTPGTPGNLKCPFANMGRQDSAFTKAHPSSLPTPPDYTKDPLADDPIAADLCAAPSSVGGSKCPIRFLDAHSPEEVAEYFENHKHEIPRSHAVCVQRYSTDATRAARIDALYGANLANMLQGLGHKHQPLLPPEERSRAVAEASTIGSSRNAASVAKPMENVEEWAEKCAETVEKAPEDDNNVAESWDSGPRAGEEDGDRTPHFERPLHDVRLGESPSRPWGIQVPEAHEPPLSAADDARSHASRPRTIPGTIEGEGSAHEDSAHEVADANNAPSWQGHRSATHSLSGDKSIPNEYPASGSGRSMPVKKEPMHEQRNAGPGAVIFNGPVFLGYSAEDAAALLQSYTNSRP